MNARSVSAESVPVALLGYGRWGENLARVLAASSACHLAAIVDLDADRRALARARHATVEVLRDCADLARLGGIEAAVVAVPPRALAAAATCALRRGLHVFVEKPAFLTSAATRIAARTAADVGRTLMFDHTDVHSPVTVALASALARSVAGQLRSWQAVRTNPGGGQPGTDVMRDLAIHDLACLDVLVRHAPLAVSATGERDPASAEVFSAKIALHYPDGLCATIEADWRAALRQRRTEIVGDRGALVRTERAGLTFAPARPAASTVDVAHAAALCDAPVRDTPDEPLARALVQFALGIRGGGAVTTDAAQAERLLTWIEAAERSMAEGGRHVPLSPTPVS